MGLVDVVTQIFSATIIYQHLICTIMVWKVPNIADMQVVEYLALTVTE